VGHLKFIFLSRMGESKGYCFITFSNIQEANSVPGDVGRMGWVYRARHGNSHGDLFHVALDSNGRYGGPKLGAKKDH
jgi:hypothetical protein